MMAGVVTALHHDPEFAEEFRTRVIAPKIEPTRAVFERARDRGEITADLDLDLLAPALAGIVLHRSFVLGLPADDETVARVVDEIILPAATRRSHDLSLSAAWPAPASPTPPTRKPHDRHATTPRATEARPGPPPPRRSLGWALVLISVAQLMVVLDATIANIALPFIKNDLDIAQANLSWIVTGYALAFGGLLLLGGRLGDLYGRRRMFMVGVVIFGVASLLGGLAAERGRCCSAPVASRASAPRIASPAALALITTTFPAGPQRNRAFAVYAAMSGAGAAVGLILGGWLTGLDRRLFGHVVDGWRLTFLINVPIGIAAALPRPRSSPRASPHPGELDLPGALTGTLGLLGVVYGLTRAGNQRTAGATPGRIGSPGRRRRCCSRLRGDRAPGRAPAAAVPHPRQPHPRGELRGDDARARRRCSRCSTSSASSSRTSWATRPLKTGVAFLPFSVGIVRRGRRSPPT